MANENALPLPPSFTNLAVSQTVSHSLFLSTKKHPTQSVGRSINVDIIVLINVLRIEKLYELS